MREVIMKRVPHAGMMLSHICQLLPELMFKTILIISIPDSHLGEDRCKIYALIVMFLFINI